MSNINTTVRNANELIGAWQNMAYTPSQLLLHMINCMEFVTTNPYYENLDDAKKSEFWEKTNQISQFFADAPTPCTVIEIDEA